MIFVLEWGKNTHKYETLIFDLAASERTGLLVEFHIDLEFYYQDYDWGIVYRYDRKCTLVQFYALCL
mgnify:CR=1 FL=1